VTLKATIAIIESTQGEHLIGLTPATLKAMDRARDGEVFEAAAAAVHTLGPRRWRGGLQTLAANVSGTRMATGHCGTTACPAYLELVEHSGVFPELFDSEKIGGPANRRVWTQVCSHQTEHGMSVEPTVMLRRDVGRP
jgi:hypothetical protein